MLTKISDALRSLFLKDKVERDLDKELRFHIDMETENNIARGMTHAEARLQALRQFGGVEKFKEECRDVRGGGLIESLLQDTRYGARILVRNPGFTVVAILTLALGIGANTAIFSVIYGVLMRPLPYKDGNQLVIVQQQAPLAGVLNMPFSVKEVLDYREHNQTLDAVVEHHTMSFTLLGGDEPQRVQTGVVSANFFDVLDRKSTRLNSSHRCISYAVFCFRDHRSLHSFPTRRSSDLSRLRLPASSTCLSPSKKCSTIVSIIKHSTRWSSITR